jgi:hypothetical protein
MLRFEPVDSLASLRDALLVDEAALTLKAPGPSAPTPHYPRTNLHKIHHNLTHLLYLDNLLAGTHLPLTTQVASRCHAPPVVRSTSRLT